MGQVVRGSASGLAGAFGPGRFSGQISDSGAADRDPGRNDAGYKKLAGFVFQQAFLDLGIEFSLMDQGEGPGGGAGRAVNAVETPVREPNEDAIAAARFLTEDYYRKSRSMWLGWLGMTDVQFQMLLRRPTFQGSRNLIWPHLSRALEALRERVSSTAARVVGAAKQRASEAVARAGLAQLELELA